MTVVMFFSQAGARPRMWEASPSEHKKWVEVGVRRAVSDFNLTRDFHFRHPLLALTQLCCTDKGWTIVPKCHD